MTPCACSMSSLRVHRALPCCPYSQLRSIRGVELPERLSGASDTAVLAWKSASQFCSVDSKADLSRKFSRSSVEASSRVRRSQGGVLRDYARPKKPISQVRYRVDDTVDSREVVEDGTDHSRRRSRERQRKKRDGERRRRVQILSNNGMVDLEEHLGLISSDDGAMARESYRGDDVDGMAAISADEEGRRILESTLLRNDVAEVQRKQDIVTSTPYEANCSYPSGQASGSERSELYEGSSDVTPSEKFRQDVIEVEVEGKHPGDGDLNSKNSSDTSGPRPMAELPGGKRVVELVAAWDGLAGRLPPEFSRSRGSDLLLRALKLTVTALKHTASDAVPRTPLCRALAVAHILVDLGMDAEVISTGLLREVADVGLVNYAVIEDNLSGSIAHLLRDCSRVRHIPSRVETLDDISAKALRQFCLAFHDVRAVVVELASQLDTMRHIHSIPRYQQQILALETMQLYAPLAHAIGVGSMALELEDSGFRVLFPDSYSRIGSWLRSHWIDGNAVVDELREQLSSRLKQDSHLQNLVTTVNVVGRYKSRFSTMRKLLKDGRTPEEVYDVLGLRVVLEPKADEKNNAAKRRELGIRACYRAMDIATSIWQEVPGRLKDYIENRKDNGYESLHVAVNVGERNDGRPPMEIQIRTTEMDDAAMSGEASHSLYKGGMTDPEQVKNLKLIMVAAANAAASRFRGVAGNAMGLEGGDRDHDDEDQIFKMFDKNRDGVISIDEFREVITELGADEGDALELMQIVDVNTDGSVSAEEFEKFRHQIQLYQTLAGADNQFSSQLGSKLEGGNEPGIEVPSPNSGESNVSGLISDTIEDSLESPTISGRSSPDASGPSSSTSSHEVIDTEGGGSSLGPSDVNISVAEEDTEGSRSKSGSPIPSLTDKPKLISVHPDPPTEDTSGPTSSGDPLTIPDVVEELSDQSSVERAPLLKQEKVASDGYDDSVEAAIEIRLSDVRRKVAEGSLELARDLAAQVSREYPSSTKALLHLASSEQKCGNLEVASALYARTVDILKFKGDLGLEYVRALQAWASLEAKAGNPDRARNLFTTCVTASEEGENDTSLRDAGVYGLHGWAMLEERRGNWTTARDLLERAAGLQPGNAVIHQSRASLEARAHNISAARIHFTRAVRAAPEDVKCWHAWAKFEAGRGNMEKARKLFKQALEVDPKNLHSLQAWAHHERRIGTAEARSQARKLYQSCVDIDPKNVHCWQSWGILEQESENYEGARMLFTQGLKLNKRSVPCMQAYAHMERKCRHLEAARVLLQRARLIEPNNAAVLMELALVEDMSGNNDAALDLYKQAASEDKLKSAVKRRMFESRKKDLQTSGSRSKSKAAPAGRNRKGTTSRRKSVSSERSQSDDFNTDDLEPRYERIHSFAATGHRNI